MRNTCYGTIPILTNEQGVEEYLLLQNHGGFWGFPKGHAELDEDPQSCAIRETAEETGIEVEKAQILDQVEYSYNQLIDKKMQTKTIVLFPVHVGGKKVDVQASEIQSYNWVTLEKAIELINLPEATAMLNQLIK